MVMVTRKEMPTKENVLQEGKRAKETTRRTKVVMVTRNEKPTKENVLKKLMMSIEGRWKLPTTRQHVLSLHIIKSVPLQEEVTDVLPKQNTGLINTNVICYSNAIFKCIASCANLDNFTDFLQSPPNEEHQHFELYCEFRSVISSIVSGGMGDIDPSKFIYFYKKRNEDFNANEGKWHDNCIKQ
jgi:hypothetical protein